MNHVMYDTYIESVIEKMRLLIRLNTHVYIEFILLDNLTIHL